jgi:phospholipase/carboxylesterase
MNASTGLVIHRPAGAAAQLVVLCHGYGADEHDLVPVGERLAAEYPAALVVSLRAPQRSALGFGYQWYPLDEDRLGQQGPGDEDRAAALAGLADSVRHWQRQANLGAEATVLLGFSQGATLVFEAVTGGTGGVGEPLAGRVIGLAGRYDRLPDLAPPATTLFLLHGKADPDVPCAHTVAAAERLVALDADVVADVLPFVGHEIPEEMLDLAIRRLRTHVPSRVWKEALADVPPPGGGKQ